LRFSFDSLGACSAVQDAELAFMLRQEFSDRDNSFDEGDVKDAYGVHGDFALVGKGKVANRYCGTFFGWRGCDNVDLHNKTMWVKVDDKAMWIRKNGVAKLTNMKGKVYMRKIFNSCDRPSCPICYKYGWAVRESRRIETRLKIASRRFGCIEHIVASVPKRDYHLSLKALRAKVDKILRARGVHGVKIWHAFRLNKRTKQWYYSPHFHVLGFVIGGYKCRGCKDTVCMGHGNFDKCKGFEARTRQHFAKDGYIVKVLGKRITVGGTSWYQLHHATVMKNVKNFHVATWFGLCGYRKLKVTPELMNEFRVKNVCPICQYDLKNFRYAGIVPSILACYSSTINDREELELFDDLEDKIGLRQWEEVRRVKRYGSED